MRCRYDALPGGGGTFATATLWPCVFDATSKEGARITATLLGPIIVLPFVGD
jgi:hypothetical protein